MPHKYDWVIRIKKAAMHIEMTPENSKSNREKYSLEVSWRLALFAVCILLQDTNQ